MSLKCGIIGLPNIGKSSFFNVILSAKAEIAQAPHAAGVIHGDFDRSFIKAEGD